MFRKAMTNNTPLATGYTTTENGALSHDGTGSAMLDYFSNALARDRATKMTDDRIVELADRAYRENPQLFMRLLAFKRWCRGGAGERHVAEVTWRWLSEKHPEQVTANLETMPFFGRFEDLVSFFTATDHQEQALNVLVMQL